MYVKNQIQVLFLLFVSSILFAENAPQPAAPQNTAEKAQDKTTTEQTSNSDIHFTTKPYRRQMLKKCGLSTRDIYF